MYNNQFRETKNFCMVCGPQVHGCDCCCCCCCCCLSKQHFVCVCEFAQSEIIVVGEIVYNNHNRCSVCSHTHTHRDIYKSVYEYFCRSQRRRFFRFCPIVSVLSLSTVVPFMSCTPYLSECTQECIHM